MQHTNVFICRNEQLETRWLTCASVNWVIIGSLAFCLLGAKLYITWTNGNLFSNRSIGTSFNEIWLIIQNFQGSPLAWRVSPGPGVVENVAVILVVTLKRKYRHLGDNFWSNLWWKFRQNGKKNDDVICMDILICTHIIHIYIYGVCWSFPILTNRMQITDIKITSNH